MKFTKVQPVSEYYCETEDGTYYRCNYNGTVWERLYGQSWEPVWGEEEKRLYAELKKHNGGYSEGPVSDGEMDPRNNV